LDYQKKGISDAPRTLFLKLTGAGLPSEVSCEKEVEFYQRLAPEMSCPPLIRCYDAVSSAPTGRSHILLDDLFETHSQPNDQEAPSKSLSRLAVEALAQAHAHWWNDPQLGKEVGTLFDAKTLGKFVAELNSSVAMFIEHCSTDLTPDQREAYELMLANANKIWGRLTDHRGLTLTHGDCHWWNFLYPNDPEKHAVHIYDWHLWHVDLGARDLAFLLALGGFAEPRPEMENELLRDYHSTLIANGVSDHSWEQLWDDYRWSAVRNLNIPVIFWSQGKHSSTISTALRRAFDSYQRLHCREGIT
jgi:hypothetical protein